MTATLERATARDRASVRAEIRGRMARRVERSGYAFWDRECDLWAGSVAHAAAHGFKPTPDSVYGYLLARRMRSLTVLAWRGVS